MKHRKAKSKTQQKPEEREYKNENLFTVSHITPYQDDLSRVIHSNFFRRLQGKSQIFSAGESDFFRNRLTHSLEVASIGKSIASKLNHENNLDISLDVVELAGLCHDIGHPPFGHQGEHALFELMKNNGGFEGNAQTIRLVARVEKLVKTNDNSMYGVGKDDYRCGLNLTARSLASLLKYDNEIPLINKTLSKGYYGSERGLVDWVKRNVTGIESFQGNFKTIECSIMDLADDIAYSTFDLVDALHAGFIRINDLMTGGPGGDLSIWSSVALEVSNALKKANRYTTRKVDEDDMHQIITELLLGFFKQRTDIKLEFETDLSSPKKYISLRNLLRKFERIAKVGYMRQSLAQYLIQRFVAGIEIEKSPKIPVLRDVYLNEKTFLEVACLKKLIFGIITSKSRVQITEYRAKHVINTIFKAIESSENDVGMLPDDFSYILKKIKAKKKPSDEKRLICDFIAGMTDRYALEFYGRLQSSDPETIFKPI